MNKEELLNFIKLARKNAYGDLSISNEILENVEKLVVYAEKKEIEDKELSDISKAFVDEAIKLAKQSKDISQAISKLTRAI